MRLLVVEDERGIANFVKEGLEEEGYAVDVAAHGARGLELASENDYDLLILDWMLPGLSGIEICRRIRKVNQDIPIIFLTAKDTTDDAIFGLETGANDYITKPFEFVELLARIRVQLRPKKGSSRVLAAGEILLDPDTHRVFRGKSERDLSHGKRILASGISSAQQRKGLFPNPYHRTCMEYSFRFRYLRYRCLHQLSEEEAG